VYINNLLLADPGKIMGFFKKKSGKKVGNFFDKDKNQNLFRKMPFQKKIEILNFKKQGRNEKVRLYFVLIE
jgi:hypothetical protein